MVSCAQLERCSACGRSSTALSDLVYTSRRLRLLFASQTLSLHVSLVFNKQKKHTPVRSNTLVLLMSCLGQSLAALMLVSLPQFECCLSVPAPLPTPLCSTFLQFETVLFLRPFQIQYVVLNERRARVPVCGSRVSSVCCFQLECCSALAARVLIVLTLRLCKLRSARRFYS